MVKELLGYIYGKDNLRAEIDDYLEDGYKINAIKLYRQNKLDKGEECGLREAKEHIDALQEKLITR